MIKTRARILWIWIGVRRSVLVAVFVMLLDDMLSDRLCGQTKPRERYGFDASLTVLYPWQPACVRKVGISVTNNELEWLLRMDQLFRAEVDNGWLEIPTGP